MLQFKHSTKVHRLETRGTNIPKFSFNFFPFDNLPEKDTFAKPLQDIIGVISHIGPFDYASQTSTNKLRKIKIQNLDEQTQEIRLWGHHGETFDEEAVLKKSQEGIVVGIFAGLTAGSFLGALHASSTSATKVYIDLDTSQVKNYQTSYKWESPALRHQLPQVMHLSPIQAAGKMYTLQQISDMPTSNFQEGATYSTIAKVKSIVPSTKWYYKGCKHCDRGYNNNSDTPTCLCTNSSPKPLYKLPITLTDDSGDLDAIAFSKIAEELVERDAIQASQNMKVDTAEHVTALDNAIGKTRLFYIGMKVDLVYRFPISYVIKKSFSVDNAQILPSTKSTPSKDLENSPSSSKSIQSPGSLTQVHLGNTMPPPCQSATMDTDKIINRYSSAKRSIQFTEDGATNKEGQQHEHLQDTQVHLQVVKKHKQEAPSTTMQGPGNLQDARKAPTDCTTFH
ncbi:uncharacterized protein [Triticum aestivum]|uniref:uncharacterized protein isoform X1 n=1 Tax=Triticum aestivum TaxID=4565 RepID=UPI001D0265BE|nr:uncharacterized protein LOC123087869 isoform X1 [Triticum aestivum]XP_044365926.1 uncharacterized protein LOC123087869 isoform X1 [Triticum aestivum]